MSSMISSSVGAADDDDNDDALELEDFLLTEVEDFLLVDDFLLRLDDKDPAATSAATLTPAIISISLPLSSLST